MPATFEAAVPQQLLWAGGDSLVDDGRRCSTPAVPGGEGGPFGSSRAQVGIGGALEDRGSLDWGPWSPLVHTDAEEGPEQHVCGVFGHEQIVWSATASACRLGGRLGRRPRSMERWPRDPVGGRATGAASRVLAPLILLGGTVCVLLRRDQPASSGLFAAAGGIWLAIAAPHLHRVPAWLSSVPFQTWTAATAAAGIGISALMLLGGLAVRSTQQGKGAAGERDAAAAPDPTSGRTQNRKAA